jgi:mRNA interferase HigB
MQVIGIDALDRAARKFADTRSNLRAWRQVVTDMSWQSLMAVRETYPHADGVTVACGSVVTVFNICGNKYRLLARIDYRRQILRVIEVLTHADYNKKRWKDRL